MSLPYANIENEKGSPRSDVMRLYGTEQYCLCCYKTKRILPKGSKFAEGYGAHYKLEFQTTIVTKNCDECK